MYAAVRDAPGEARLDEYDPAQTHGLKRDEAAARLEALGAELETLQELLYGAAENALLVVLQGRDTSGKDGVINNVFGYMNTQGLGVASFKAPTEEERARDFLWRVHAHAPAKGQVVLFNRSHYEDVLAARVRGLVPPEVWERRYAQINAFEQLLHETGTIILKFFLHISADEQAERLRAREEKPEKAWKLNPGDWEERRYWDDYTRAYEDALGRCAAPHAPWFIVPSDKKWFRNLAVAEALALSLRPYRESWTRRLEEIGARQREALQRMREQERADG